MASDFDVRMQAVITDVQGVVGGGTIAIERPLIAGKADPFTTIDVYDGTTLLGVVTSNGQGSWTLQLSNSLSDGTHQLAAVQLNEFGAAPTASYFAITVDTSANPQFAHDEIPLFDQFRGLIDSHGSHTDSDVPYFPPNLFKQHAATGNTSAANTDKPIHGLIDPAGDPLNYVRQTSAPLDNGKGFDMVSFLGDHQVLNLSNFTEHAAATQTQSVVGFDLGGHHNALKVSLADVLSLGEQDLFMNDGKQQLIVNGKEGDSVDLTTSHPAGLSEGDWHHHGTAEVGGVLYNVIEHTAANTELLVEHTVRIEMH